MLPYLVNGISLGLNIALVALALALVWRTVGMIDFGLGAVYLLAAYAVLVLSRSGLPLAASLGGALIVGTLSGIGLYFGVYRFFIRRQVPLFVLVLVALSVLLGTQHLLATLFSAQKFYVYDAVLPGIELLGTRLNAVQMAKMAVSLLALGSLAFFCLRTRPGNGILAVADNAVLARAVGIDVDRAYALTFGIAALVVSAAALPDIVESGIDPYIATNPVFLALAAIIIGGLGSFRNPVLGALLLGIAFHLAVWVFSSSWQEVIAYALVIFVLALKPQGLFGGLQTARGRA